MKLFSVDYWPDRLSLSQEYIPARRSNEFYVPCGQGTDSEVKVVAEPSCVQLLPLKHGGRGYFLNGKSSIAMKDGKPRIVAGQCDDALVHITHYPRKNREIVFRIAPITGLTADQVVADSAAGPTLITLKANQELTFSAEMSEMIWERVAVKRSSLLYWLGMRTYSDRVEKKTTFTFYMMFDGSELRIYTAEERV